MLWERSSEIPRKCVCSDTVQCVVTYRKHCSSFCFTDKFEIYLKMSHGKGQVQISNQTSKCFPDAESRILSGFRFMFCFVFLLLCFGLFVCFEGANTPAPICVEVSFIRAGHKSCTITVCFQPRLI